MFKIFSCISTSIVLLWFVMPQQVFAAELLFEQSSDGQAIEVRVNPQSKEMNVVEGTIQFSGPGSDGLSVQIENGHSIFPIWPTPPQYDENTKSIMFVGGVPNGFSEEGLLFRLQLSQTIPGDLQIAYVDGVGYLNDGQGTTETISSQSLAIHVDTNVETSEMPADTDDVSTISADASPSNKSKYVTIILLGVVVGIVVRYVFKKKYKQ